MPIIDTDTPEGKEALKAQIEEAVSGLAAKNKELLAEVKEARKSRTIDPKEIEERDNEIEALKGQLNEAQKTVKEATKQAETFKKSLEGAEGFTHKLLVDNGLNDALAKSGVTNPVHLKFAKSVLASQVAIVADGDNRVAKIGDKDLASFVGEWAKGEEGKFFVNATQNAGGGAGGGSNTPLSKNTGNLGGTRSERVAALESRFPELSNKG
jgi:hypothetical protein